MMKRQRESLRGLSHEDKVKRIEKLTKVPMRNLKTNIIESDLEEDDVDVPISLKQVTIGEVVAIEQKDKQPTNNKQKNHLRCCDYEYAQQKINKSIRAMTTQLYSLQRQRQSLSKNVEKQPIVEPNISNFTIEEIDLELQKLGKKGEREDGVRGKQRREVRKQGEGKVELNDIRERLNQQGNRMSVEGNKKQPLIRRTQFVPQRQTQPLYPAQTSAYPPQPPKPQTSQQNKRQSSSSSVTKRFSRTKHHPDSSHNDNLLDKKLKFNRSSNLNNKQIPNLNINNKENHENFEQPKRHLLTQRLSFQQMPTYDRPQTALKKRKNAAKPFDQHHEESQNENFQNALKKELIALKPNFNSQSTRQRIRQQIAQFQRLSQAEVFNKFSQYNIRGYTFNQKEREVLTQMFKSYKQTIDLLRISL